MLSVFKFDSTECYWFTVITPLWAKENPGVAELVENQEMTDLAHSIKKLAESSEYRYKLATNALKMGFNYFSHANIIQHFYQSITQKSHKSLDELEIEDIFYAKS